MFSVEISDGLFTDHCSMPYRSMDVELSMEPIYMSEFMIDFGAGLLGGSAGLAFGHPFDTIKVRQQTTTGSKLTIARCLKNTFLKEGPRGLFKGMAFPLAAVGFQNSVFFGVYGNIIRHLSKEEGGGPSKAPGYTSIMLAGAFAGGIQAFFASPIELVKVKMQAQTEPSSRQYRGPMQCMSSIYHEFGVRGVFRGLPATIMREVPGLSVYITSYQYICDHLPRAATTAGGGGGDACSVPQMLVAGGLAGIMSWVVNIPVDIVKTRMQADNLTSPRYTGTIDCFRKSYRADGLRVFWRGLPVTCIRAFPTNAVTFAVYSSMLQYMHSLVDPRTETGQYY